MNGLKSWIYFLAHYVDFLISAILSMAIFLLAAAAFRLEIVSINPGPIIILLIVWINTAIWDNDPPSPYFIWPPFACYTAVGIINSRAVSLDAPALTASTMGDGGEL